jgi:cytochrome c peroxidase
MKNIVQISVLLFGVAIATYSCKKSSPSFAGKEVLELPAITPSYNLKNPMVNNDKALLGRVLFFDKHLSLNNSVSCGTCHQQSAAFADHVTGSQGLENKTTHRNSIAIQNLASDLFNGPNPIFATAFQPLFWDGRERSITNLMMRPVTNHVEMGITDLSALVEKLNQLTYYKDLVNAAYGTDKLTLTMMSESMSQFCTSIRSNNSRFDMFVRQNLNNQNNILSPQELEGFQLFTSTQYQCNACHTSMLMSDAINNGGGIYGGGGKDSTLSKLFSANIGLQNVNSDPGVGAVNGVESQKGMFKIPDLHNVVLTAPYMHDGSIATLEGVLDHYSNRINSNINLDDRLKNADGSPRRMHIPSHDKEAIIAFLHSLTDVTPIVDKDLSNPFVIKK